MKLNDTALGILFNKPQFDGAPVKHPEEAHIFDPTIVRTSDIRGIFGKTLFAADAHAIGQAFGSIIRACGGSHVCVGYDGRLSSPILEKALVEGLVSTGVNVRRIGLGPSPMLYFAVHHFDAHGGIMITGSHNPAEYNGFKMMLGKASFFGRDLERLAEIAARGSFARDCGRVVTSNINDLYVQRLIEGITPEASLKVAWDPGNGATAEILKKLIKYLPGDHILINDEIDGRFPAHHPDPTIPEYLIQLQDLVRQHKCDFGVAFDGDGDRIGVIDNEGEILWGDQLLVLFAEQILQKNPGATIIADVKASQSLFDKVTKLGGDALMWKTGHALIKSKMVETSAPLAGEMSGHIFFADQYYGFDDALYAAVRLFDIVSHDGCALHRLRLSLPKTRATPELRLPCPEELKRPIVEAVLQHLQDDNVDYIGIDGARVCSKAGWWLLRASNTQDILVARCEARSKQALSKLLDQLKSYLQRSGYEGDLKVLNVQQYLADHAP